jgi:hypothetical protein
LRLSLGQPVALGTVLSVRSTQYLDCAPWVQVEVRNCKADKDRWLVGCRFVQPQPWGIVLLFG